MRDEGWVWDGRGFGGEGKGKGLGGGAWCGWMEGELIGLEGEAGCVLRSEGVEEVGGGRWVSEMDGAWGCGGEDGSGLSIIGLLLEVFCFASC